MYFVVVTILKIVFWQFEEPLPLPLPLPAFYQWTIEHFIEKVITAPT